MSESYQSKQERRQRLLESLPEGLRPHVSVRNIEAVQEAVRARGWDVQIGGELFSDAMGTPGTAEGTYIGMVKHNIDTIVNALQR